jgi:hypothetical protein
MTLTELIQQVEALTPDGAPLDRLAAATQVADEVEELSDHLVGHFVDVARDSGASWSQIGTNLGVSKQAAQQRFVPGETAQEVFTNRAAVVLLKAQNMARDRGAENVTAEHIALGLTAEWPGIAGQALEALGVTAEALQSAIEASLPPVAPTSKDHRPLSTAARRTLELARRRGLRMGHRYVGTEHLLLGLVDSGERPVVGTLAALADSEDLVGDLEAAIGTALEEWNQAHPA